MCDVAEGTEGLGQETEDDEEIGGHREGLISGAIVRWHCLQLEELSEPFGL